jgi:hypothetical protein
MPLATPQRWPEEAQLCASGVGTRWHIVGRTGYTFCGVSVMPKGERDRILRTRICKNCLLAWRRTEEHR